MHDGTSETSWMFNESDYALVYAHTYNMLIILSFYTSYSKNKNPKYINKKIIRRNKSISRYTIKNFCFNNINMIG